MSEELRGTIRFHSPEAGTRSAKVQHLAAFGVMSRGQQALANQLHAGCHSAHLWTQTGGGWLKHTSTGDPSPEPNAATGQPQQMAQGPQVLPLGPTLEKEPRYGAGAVMVLPPGTTDYEPDNSDGAHIGFVLRVGRLPGDSKKPRAQMLDTGGFGVPGRDSGVRLYDQNAYRGNYDGPATVSVTNGKHPSRGTGVFEPINPGTAKELRDHVRNNAKRARPIGFARLTLIKRAFNLDRLSVDQALDEGHVIYVSRLLTMYERSTADHNYALARYAWSLRDLPNAAELRAVWLIYNPTGELAQQMRSKPDRTPADMATAAEPGSDAWRTLARYTKPLAVLTVRTDGTVYRMGASRDAGSYAYPLSNVEGRIEGPVVRLKMDEGFKEEGSFPEYFRGAR